MDTDKKKFRKGILLGILVGIALGLDGVLIGKDWNKFDFCRFVLCAF